jgi:prolyl-tRNA editing enzyme YbaK/EbsC (Cys-tRNA(Pro) deacylase)
VEQIAAVFRQAGAEARLEELPDGEEVFPGAGVRVEAFECDGRVLVALVPADREADATKLGCVAARRIDSPAFPFRGSTVYFDRTLFGERTVWIEAGSPRHVAGVSPEQLARLVEARVADVTADE